MDEAFEQQLVQFRVKLGKKIHQIRKLEATAVPPAVQELVLARRSLEDARMRVGVALGYTKGDDPFWSVSEHDQVKKSKEEK